MSDHCNPNSMDFAYEMPCTVMPCPGGGCANPDCAHASSPFNDPAFIESLTHIDGDR